MKSLPELFLENLKSLLLSPKDQTVLLAVSGGLDSMVMMHLFYRSGYNCFVAHCNFQLRGKESDGDEELVKQTAANYRFPFLSIHLPAKNHAQQQGVSVQMSARELRYSWFHELAALHRLNFIATAHHADDVAETMLLNLVRGSGIAGMHGIRSGHSEIIRPLLFATRDDLEAYAIKQKLKWRNDSSNADNHYRRNLLRNQVMPVLKEINPSVSKAMTQHAKIMEGYEKLISHYLEIKSPELTTEYFNGIIRNINLDRLAKLPSPESVLFHLLQPYDVPAGFTEEILNSGTGAEFFANGYRFVRDRNELNIFAPDYSDETEYLLEENAGELKVKFGILNVHTSVLPTDIVFSTLPGFGESTVAYIDSDTLKFPLTVRRWRIGDRFQPLGMNGSRLLSDFFTDEKFSSAMKEVVYLLLSDDRVVWVAGHRIGEPFRLQRQSRQMTRFTFRPNR